MSNSLIELIGPTASMAYLREGVKARQVTTHTHDAVPVAALKRFQKIGEVFVRKRVPAHLYLWINIYYDDSDTPAISAPVGHFFGNGTSRYVHFSSKFVGMTSGGYYSFLPMPFKKSCRVVMENRHPTRTIPLFYGAVTYHQVPDIGPDVGYLNSHYRENTFTGSDDIDGAMVPDNPHVILEEDWET